MTTIDIDKIKILKNTRSDIDQMELSNMMADIRENGLIHPITVWKEGEEYVVACGHRRFLALKKLGRKSLVVGEEVKIRKGKMNAVDFLILNLNENLHRVDNTPVELGKVCLELKELGLSNSEIASRLSLPKSKIETALNLIKTVPEEMRQHIGYIAAGNTAKKGKISATVANRISTMRATKEERKEVYTIAKKEDLTIRDVEVLARMLEEGRTVKQAMEDKDKVQITSVTFVLNRTEVAKLNGKKISAALKEIIIGKAEANPKLLY